VHLLGSAAGRRHDLVAEAAARGRVQVDGDDLVAALAQVLGDLEAGRVVGEEGDRGDGP
jgi:hypothetical protein